MWLSHPSFRTTLQTAWNSDPRPNTTAVNIEIFARKLGQSRVTLQKWNKHVYGNIHAKIRRLKSHLNCIQMTIAVSGPRDHLLIRERDVAAELLQALKDQETDLTLFMRKSRINYLQAGDLNTRFFNSTLIRTIMLSQEPDSQTKGPLLLENGSRTLSLFRNR